MKLSTTKNLRKKVIILEEEDHQNIRMPAEYKKEGTMFVPTKLIETYEEWNNGHKKTITWRIELVGPVLKKDGTPHATNLGTMSYQAGYGRHKIDDLPERFRKYTEVSFEGEWPWPSTS